MAELLEQQLTSPPSTIGPLRIADYLSLPDEPRCELVYGRLYVSPAPKVLHQEVVALVYERLRRLATEIGGRAVFFPVDVILREHTVVQPDVVYVSKARQGMVRDRIEGSPDLVVEVLSPNTELTDRGAKLRLYAENEVLEYWLVNPTSMSFEFFVNVGGQFAVALPEDDLYVSSIADELAIDITAFWEDLDRRTE